MAPRKKSLISALKTAKKANIASAKPESSEEAVSVDGLKLVKNMRNMRSRKRFKAPR
jgi:hypothetical protein